MKEKGISKIITAAVITIVVVVAGIGAYFLMEAENSKSSLECLPEIENYLNK